MGSSTGEPQILLVEDVILVAAMVQRMLTDLGYAVVGTATTVDEAMEMIGSGGIDAAILDINLDGEVSYPVANKLTACGIPFVFSTGYSSADLPDAYQGLNILKKPYRRSGLEAAMGDLLLPRQSADVEGIGAAPAISVVH